jgi:putative membrane-bound dehydrogenase-like protein
MESKYIRFFSVFILSLFFLSCKSDSPRRLELFFLGHNSKHHDSEKLAEIFSQEYFKEGINITYSTDPEDLTSKDLARYDGLILYANHDSISPNQAKALLDYVASGKGFIPIHSASYCFRNSPEVVNLIGGQFKTHKGGSFSAEIIKPDHPALKGVTSFTTEWDETYVHDKIADDIEVLMERVENGHREPYTWVKSHGKGRVFYTAFGHDERTFTNPGFLQLVKSGILWAVGEKAAEQLNSYNIAQAIYEDAHLPNYEKRDPAPKYQLPLSPEESQTLIQVPVGFKLELFVSEPDVKKPIAMEWDERGRLWIIETVDYPNTVRNDNGKGDDRILILEDTNNDGKADKITVFADGLNIPTGFVFSNGGIIVSQAPDFLFLKDTDGDDKADVREVLMHGWGTFDTHAGPSNLRYGLDNKIWGTVGYSGFEGVIDGNQMKFSSGLYSFTPQAKDFEYKANTTNNTWGLGFSEDFDVFVSTANNEHSDFFAIPNRYYERANLSERGIQKIDSHYGMHVVTKNLRQVDVHGGFTAAAGHSLYTARSFPKEYWNRVAFINEPTGRVVHKHILEQDGSGFKEVNDGWNIVASADEWFGPVEAKVGPDGSLWIIDWYNFIIQHNPTPEGAENGEGNAYIDPLRDNTRGRIYRLVHEDAGSYKPYKLDKNDPSSLLNALKSDNMFWRTTAQRLLVESEDKKVATDLFKFIQNTSIDEVNVNGAAIHSLWTLHGLGLLDGSNKEAISVAVEALNHPAPGVRRAAVQVLPVNNPEVVERLISSKVLSDADLRVRLATLLRLADAAPSPRIGKAVYDAVQKKENVDDKWISHALLIAGTLNREDFVAEFSKNNGKLNLSNANGTLLERIVAGNDMVVRPLTTERGGTLGARQIPDFSEKELTVVADVELPNGSQKEGVLINQGDDKNGYAIYIKDQRVYFQVNQKGRKTVINSKEESIPKEFNVKGQLLAGGKMRLYINNNLAAEGATGGLFATVPAGNLKIGHNKPERGRRGQTASKVNEVGDYQANFNFEGAIKNARLVIVNSNPSEVDIISTPQNREEAITINVVIGEMKFDKTSFTAKAGSTLKITLVNPDFMQHNLLIIKPGTLEKVGKAVDEMAKSPSGADLQYIPDISEVLYATPLVNPDSKFELTIKVPEVPGVYPFVCTFPGHWRIMQGVMNVVK